MRGNFGIRPTSTLHSTPSTVRACLLLCKMATKQSRPSLGARCHTLSPEARGVGAETPMRTQQEEWARARPTRGEEHGRGPRWRAVTDDPHCCSLSWDPWAANYTGSEHRRGPPAGTSGLLAAGQTGSSLQYSTVEEPLRATPAVCALKCQLHTVFGRGQPLHWGARGGGAGLLGPSRRHT